MLLKVEVFGEIPGGRKGSAGMEEFPEKDVMRTDLELSLQLFAAVSKFTWVHNLIPQDLTLFSMDCANKNK